MRFLLLFIALTIAVPVHAALVDKGSFTTDTGSGLDWLDLTETDNMSMLDAVAANSGWRLATESEVQGLFAQLFDGYYANDAFGIGYSYSYDGPTYADQIEDILNMQSLFGVSIVEGQTWQYTMGMYLDDGACYGDPCVRLLGARYINSTYHMVYGPDYWPSDSQELNNTYYDINSDAAWGTFLVRSTVVPIPAAAWLFTSALAGLGFFRRRLAAP